MINKILLEQRVNEKFVYVTKHPAADLYIYHYSKKTQYNNVWDEITLKTRGLILDGEMNIISRPFGKFFNLGEPQPEDIPNLPFEVYEKLDGSLTILYWLNDKPYLATKGSFESDVANYANKILYDKYQHTFDKMDKNKTYLFEIICPINKLVIDYGNEVEELFLLAIIDNETGNDLPLEDIGFPLVKKYDGIKDLKQLQELNIKNKEGFVIKFSNDFRLKIKFKDYVNLHRIITGTSNIAIWEYLSQEKSFDELLEKVPDEFYEWVKETKEDLIAQFNQILNESKAAYKKFGTIKETALYFNTQEHKKILFAMLNGKNYEKLIWGKIKPEFNDAKSYFKF